MDFLAIIISLIALVISIGNVWLSQVRASVSVFWAKQSGGSMRFLILKNHGPGPATITNVEEFNHEAKKKVGLKYVEDRREKLFPFVLGPGASQEIQLDQGKPPPEEVYLEWTEGFNWKREMHSYIFSSWAKID